MDTELDPRTSSRDCPQAARILLVEDDLDTAHLLCLSLELEGYAVRVAFSVDEALAALREQRVELLLTDYDLPGKTGAVLLREAARAGLLERTGCVVVTAHPNPVGIDDGVPIVRKPIDFARFLEQIQAILNAGNRHQAAASEARASSAGPAPLVHLVLYVSPRSLPSARARQTLASVLARYDASVVRHEICDLAENASQAEADRVVFTPTLVRHAPEPVTWVVGDLSDTAVLTDLLALSGVSANR